MALTQPHLPAVDPDAFLQKPLMERMRLLATDWAENGFGSTRLVHLTYIVKLVVFFAIGGITVATATSGLGCPACTFARRRHRRDPARTASAGPMPPRPHSRTLLGERNASAKNRWAVFAVTLRSRVVRIRVEALASLDAELARINVGPQQIPHVLR